MSDIAEPEKRRWARRRVNLTVRMLFPKHGLRDVWEARFRLNDISEGGASLFVGKIVCPDFFYLQFGDEHSPLVGCYVVQRMADNVSCRFTSELKTEELNKFIEDGNMRASLDALFDTSGVSELDSIFEHAGDLFVDEQPG